VLTKQDNDPIREGEKKSRDLKSVSLEAEVQGCVTKKSKKKSAKLRNKRDHKRLWEETLKGQKSLTPHWGGVTNGTDLIDQSAKTTKLWEGQKARQA